MLTLLFSRWDIATEVCEFVLFQRLATCLKHLCGSLNKFPVFFHMGTFIDSTHETLVPFEVISSSCNTLVVPFQQLLEGSMEVLLCVNDLRHNLGICKNYLGITLTAIAARVFNILLLNCICSWENSLERSKWLLEKSILNITDSDYLLNHWRSMCKKSQGNPRFFQGI